jgi:heme exporter protein C
MWTWLHKLGSPQRYYGWTGRLLPWLAVACALLMAGGLYGGLVLAPPDYQQGESYRIIYIHVPAAWMSMFAYMVMAFAAVTHLIWHIKVADMVAEAAAPLGASFTFIALVTGALWGKPMWGAWWVWDARLTSELILLFLYLGYMALRGAIEDPRQAARASGVLAIVGMVNIPIIHYSVEWWNTLHQGPTVTKFDSPSIHLSMLIPLLMMALAFKLFFAVMVLVRTRTQLIERERNTRWVQELLAEQ